MNKELFSQIDTSAQIVGGLILIAILLLYIAFYKKDSSSKK